MREQLGDGVGELDLAACAGRHAFSSSLMAIGVAVLLVPV